MKKYIIFLFVIFSFTFLSNPIFAIKPQKEYVAIPSDYGIIYRNVSFITVDSLRISGWFFPAQDTSGILNEYVGKRIPDSRKSKPRPYQIFFKKGRPTLIICNGDAGNMSYLILYSYHFITNGYNVLTFDWRGFGKSDDWHIEKNMLCYTEFLLDYDAAINFVKKQPEVDSTKIAIFGFSTGAYLSFAEIVKRKDISAFVGRALLTSFDDVLKKIKPDRELTAPSNYPKHLLPVNSADKIIIPVYLIVGEKDDRTPPWMSKMIYGKVKGPKELWIVPNASHGGGNGPEFKNYPEFFKKVLAFLDNNLK